MAISAELVATLGGLETHWEEGSGRFSMPEGWNSAVALVAGISSGQTGASGKLKGTSRIYTGNMRGGLRRHRGLQLQLRPGCFAYPAYLAHGVVA